jgi:hypothetical protein
MFDQNKYKHDYYMKNRESIRIKHKDYYQDNKIAIMEQQTRYRRSNAEKFLEYSRNYRRLNRDKITERRALNRDKTNQRVVENKELNRYLSVLSFSVNKHEIIDKKEPYGKVKWVGPGMTFGHLRVTGKKTISQRGGYSWECECGCGRHKCLKVVWVKTHDLLKSNNSRSCGKTVSFWDFVEKNPKDIRLRDAGCWEWVGSFRSIGRYKFAIWRNQHVRRYLYKTVIGEIGGGIVHCRCGNEKCVNPHHVKKVDPLSAGKTLELKGCRTMIRHYHNKKSVDTSQANKREYFYRKYSTMIVDTFIRSKS